MPGRRTFATAFDPKHNALALLRLLLAALVVWHHAYPIGGYDTGLDPLHRATGGRVALGPIAVCGFFALSGFLVTRSWVGAASRAGSGAGISPLLRFLWHRGLRILPGFWLALLLTAFVLAPIGFARTSSPLDGFPWRAAAAFVRTNAALPIHQSTIPGVMPSLGFGDGAGAVLNGSLWTLVYEAACYLVVALLGMLGLLAKRTRAVVPVLLLVACVATIWARDAGVDLSDETVMMSLTPETLRFLVAFLTGATAALWADRLPGSPAAGLAAVAVSAGSIAWWGWEPWGVVSSSFALLWLGAVLPFRRADRFGDASYGLYLLAFPVGQLLATTALLERGPILFTVTNLALTLPLAFASWHLVERQALRLKTWRR